ncbi:MAG: hypothetical protein PSV16_04580 [Flavobacterium sp.]|nr:hypothetical protein [Flavobacterium sp.]
MKANVSLRFFGVLGFLLLMTPFYDSCNGKGLCQKIPEGQLKEPEKTFSDKAYDFIVCEESLTGFELAELPIISIYENPNLSKVALKKAHIADFFTFFITLFFLFCAMISFVTMCLTFTDKLRLIQKLALLNVVLIFITFFYIVFFESSFETITQIKWGYYAFIAVQIAIVVQSKRMLKLRAAN